MADEPIETGWYGLKVFGAYSTMKEAATIENEDGRDEDLVKEFRNTLKTLDALPYGAAFFGDGEQLMVIDKFADGSVIGMLTFAHLQADSPNEAYRLANAERIPARGPLLVRWLDFDSGDKWQPVKH